MIEYILFFKGLCTSLSIFLLPLKMNIKASHYSFVLMMVTRECLIIIIHSPFTAMSILHKYVYFQRICHMELLCSVHIIILTVSVMVGSRAGQTWFSSFLLYLSALSSPSYWISLSLSFPIKDMEIMSLIHRIFVRILVSSPGSI